MAGSSRIIDAARSTEARVQNFHSSLAAPEYWNKTWSTSNAFSSPAGYRSMASPTRATSAGLMGLVVRRDPVARGLSL